MQILKQNLDIDHLDSHNAGVNWRFWRLLSTNRWLPTVVAIVVIVAVVLVITIFILSRSSGSLVEQTLTVKMRDDLTTQQYEKVKNIIIPTSNFTKSEVFEKMSGGAATSLKMINHNAFSHPSANITFAEQSDFSLGNGLFRKLWVSSPSSTQASDGLGPFFNARSCQACHIKDGRGQPPENGADASSMFLRLARTPSTIAEKEAVENLSIVNFPDPIYGGQLQNFAVAGLLAEGEMKVSYKDYPVTLGDGTIVVLRKPTYSAINLAYGDMHPDTTFSPRVAPPMIGMGLIQAIHQSDIIALADPQDRNGDDISGKIAKVRDAKTGKLLLGRFGWKAQNPSIRAQSGGAFAGDIGISTPDNPSPYGDCTAKQPDCLARPTGVQPRLGSTEAPDPVLDLVTFYSENLAVPARRNINNKQVLLGKKIFYKIGCISCHQPKFVTSRKAKNKAHQFQLIWPYSDFLLHDMGEGLADGQQVGVANGREWRTPPLWGIGLTKIVSNHTFFLHDGRARNLSEAILWHGGEAKNTRERYALLNRESRNNLIKFLESL